MVAGAASSLGFEGARAAQLSLGLLGAEARDYSSLASSARTVIARRKS